MAYTATRYEDDMKTILLSSILSCALATAFAQDAPEKKLMEHLVSVGRFTWDVPGTTLQSDNTFASDAKEGWSSHDCTIGYSQHSDDGKDWTFVPVLELPRLKNDRYRVECQNGVLTVTTQGKSPVVTLNLKALAPSLVTTKPAEQAGADQPATKPADTPPVKDQPSTPTSKDGPR